jgi:hypothetical protein
LVVLKFIVVEKIRGEKTHEAREEKRRQLLEDAKRRSIDECTRWKVIFDVDTGHIYFPIHSNYVVAMPYAFTCHEDPLSGEHHFRPFLNSVATANAGDNTDERCLKETNVTEMLAALDAETMARQAIDVVVNAGYVHMDVQWRHVAALPVWKKSSAALLASSQKSKGRERGRKGKQAGRGDCGGKVELVGFRAVLIDLSNVPTLESEKISAEEAKSRMLQALGLQDEDVSLSNVPPTAT